jgi:hypothetical protein
MATVLYDTGFGNGNALRTVVLELPSGTATINLTTALGLSATAQIVSISGNNHNQATGALVHAYCAAAADSITSWSWGGPVTASLLTLLPANNCFIVLQILPVPT